MNKRDFLKSAAGLLAASSAIGVGRAQAAETDSCGRVANPATFVLVHGAWAGGFYLEPMAEVLRRRGHRVFVPTLTGLGERSHLISRDVNLTMHITDVKQVFKYEKLSDVVLVGHSYGGYVITGVADQLTDKLRSLVFLDAFIPTDGKSFADDGGPFGEELKKRWDAGGVSYAFPAGNPAGDNPLLTPHPLGTLVEPAHVTGNWMKVPKKMYVAAASDQPTGFSRFYDKYKADPAWVTHTMEGGHGFPENHYMETALLAEEAI